MYTIHYTTKTTAANTVYMTIKKEDMTMLISKMLALQSYFNELSLTSNKDIKEVLAWYKKPNKSLPFNRQFSKYNSPCSFIAGMINNLVYSDQHDCSEVQAQHIQNVVNTASELISAISDMGIKLQKNSDHDSIFFAEQLFDFK
jgi:hypothetical protein